MIFRVNNQKMVLCASSLPLKPQESEQRPFFPGALLSVCGLFLSLLLSSSLVSAEEKRWKKQKEEAREEAKKEAPSEVELLLQAAPKEVFLDLAQNLNAARDTLTTALEKVKTAAQKKNDADELLRVDALEREEGYQAFTNPAAIKAQEAFDARLREILKKALPEFKKGLVVLYGKDKEPADALSALLVGLESNLKLESIVRKTGKLNANMQRLETTIEVRKGSRITIEAEGEWRPGGFKGPKGRTHNTEYGDANTYNVAMFVGDTHAGIGGKKWEAVAPASGKLAFQMAGHGQTRGDADGFQNLRITVISPEVLKELMIFAGFCVKAASAPEEAGGEKTK